ncbi:MAG: TrkH family potassium uptake protein [Syntrophales bacterium]|nr:TrkH family potassium uptake protein [Syntrophales bacterium]
MNFRLISRLIAMLVIFLGVFMLLPLCVSFFYEESCVTSLFFSFLLTISIGSLLYFLSRGQEDDYLSHRDGVLVVAGGWIVSGLVATLPYILSGSIPSFTDALFESVSGFTTTGSSILTNLEVLPKGILLWRSQTQWLGGMGIIVLTIAVLPFLGVGGMQLYKAETPSPVVDKLTPRIAETAAALWKIYVVFTLFEIFFLLLGGLTFFEAVCHAFTTLPTGGFSTRNASIGAFGSYYTECVFVFFMFISGMSFTLHYRFISGNRRVYLKDPEFKTYLCMVLFFVGAVTIDLFLEMEKGFFESFREAIFQVVSIITTTGYVTVDFEKWPVFSQYILLICMFLGCMAGSTGGGIKIMRFILLVRHAYLEIVRIIHPHATTVVKFGNLPVPQHILRSVWGFFLLYLIIFVMASLLLAVLGLDMISSIAAVATCLGNVGPGLGVVGPMDNFALIPQTGKWILIFCMLLGRLEIYTVIVLIVPAFWRR